MGKVKAIDKFNRSGKGGAAPGKKRKQRFRGGAGGRDFSAADARRWEEALP
jgi:hypothetical protein